VFLADDVLFQQLNPGLYTVGIAAGQQVSAELVLAPTEVPCVAVLWPVKIAGFCWPATMWGQL